MTSKQWNPNPVLFANKWSQLFHGWISQLLDINHKQGTLHPKDLYDLLPEYESKTLTEKLEDNWFDELKRNPEKPSLFRATIHTMRWAPITIGLLRIPAKASLFMQSLLMIFLMDFFEPCSTMSIQFAYFLAILMFFATLSASFFYQRYFHSVFTFGLRMRVSYHGMIYRKVLRLSSHSLNTFSSGEITNIFSNDASHIEKIPFAITALWIGLIDIIAMIIFFWHFIKYISLIAIGYTIVMALLASLISHFLVYFKTRILQVTDERIKIMSEIIRSMRIVKMYCWEAVFEKKIRLVRKQEMIRYTFYLILDSIQMSFSHTYFCVAFLIIYGTMWSLNMRFDTRLFAIASCMLNYLEVSGLEFFGSIRDLVHYLTAEKRLKAFLLLDESERDHRLSSTSSNTEEHVTDKKDEKMVQSSRIECNLEQAQWQQNGLFSLKNIAFNAYPGDLICVIGPVGSGKSSLLQTLSGEIAYFDGKVRLRGSFCYVPQESWIFSSTIRKNILFGKEYNSQLFRRVVHAAALEADFAQLPNGANTLVGDQGVMLSGGQKARVNMARALYRDADIYLLDDPLSAVDAKVSKHLFDNSIKRYLRDKICILVTHQIQFLQDATKIIVLDNGEMIQMGTYAELLESSPSFNRLLENIHQQEQKQDERPMDKQEELLSRSRCVTLSEIETRGERVPRSRCVTFSEIDNQPERFLSRSRDVTFSEMENVEDQLLPTENVETKGEGSLKWRVYIEYLRACFNLVLGSTLLMLVFSSREITSVFYSWWLAKWSEEESYRHKQLNNCTKDGNNKLNIIHSMNEIEWNDHRNRRFHFYCGIALVLVILTLLRTVTIKFMCLNAGRVLHNKMFQRLIHCPILFFDLNPVGRLLNRFTKDVVIIDELLPAVLFDFLHSAFQVLGTVVLVGWLNPWSFISAAIATSGMLFIRYRFARCSRDLKRLEGTTRSPFYSYLVSTMHGLKVIRSYHAENICSSEFFAHLDNNTRAGYLFWTTNRWAAIRFDWITLFFITVVTLLAITVRVAGRQFSAADIALTVTYSLNLMGLLQWTIRVQVDVESQMTSVERVLEYCSLEQEPPAQVPSKHRPPTNWPSQGHIIFDNVSMSHSNEPHAPLALQHISLTIEAGEKIGIVGRTGAGKSSFIQTLFRMGTIVDGHIEIDNIDIATVGLDDVRRRISIIPQDPVLFSGTMRSNLDQFGDYSDVELWHALEQVQLKKLVSDIMSNGLHSLVTESGSNLSVGQKQLICLARAILKKSKILVIDEATANVDNATDELIQRAIRDKFKECTVLTVAHRLRTVIDSDRIMVLGNGELLEFDRPDVLLSDDQSHFGSLVEQTGAAEAEYLRILTTRN